MNFALCFGTCSFFPLCLVDFLSGRGCSRIGQAYHIIREKNKLAELGKDRKESFCVSIKDITLCNNEALSYHIMSFDHFLCLLRLVSCKMSYIHTSLSPNCRVLSVQSKTDNFETNIMSKVNTESHAATYALSSQTNIKSMQSYLSYPWKHSFHSVLERWNLIQYSQQHNHLS